MQSGGGSQGGGAHGQNSGVAPTGRSFTSSSAAAASPSLSSSTVLAPHLGFESIQQQQRQPQQLQHQQQLQHHLLFRQSLQQQLRMPETEEALLAYQARGINEVMGGSHFPSSSGSLQLLQQSSQQHGSMQNRDESQIKGQSLEQHMQNRDQPYVNYALQHSTQQREPLGNLMQQQRGKIGMMGSASGSDQDMLMANLKMQELISIQAANQLHVADLRKPVEHFVHGAKQMEQAQQSGTDQRSDSKLPQVSATRLLMTPSAPRTLQAPQAYPSSSQNVSNNQFSMDQLQAIQAWVMEHNIDLSLPGNADLISQLLPLWQSQVATQKLSEASDSTQPSRLPSLQQQSISSPLVGSDNSVHGNSSSDVYGQSASARAKQTIQTGPFTSAPPAAVNVNSIQIQRHAVHSQDAQGSRQPYAVANGMHPMNLPQSSVNMSMGNDSSQAKISYSGPENVQMQYLRQLQLSDQPSSHPAVSSVVGGLGSPTPLQSRPATQTSQPLGFTEQQLDVLKAQISAFRHLKRGEDSLPQEVVRAIAPSPLDSQLHQIFHPPGTSNQDRLAGKNIEDHARRFELNEKTPQVLGLNKSQIRTIEGCFTGEEKVSSSTSHMQVVVGPIKDPAWKEVQNAAFSRKSELEVERTSQNIPTRDKGKATQLQDPVSDAVQAKKPSQTSTFLQPKDVCASRQYTGPLFDIPSFTYEYESSNKVNSLTLANDVKDLGMEVLKRKRAENLQKIGGLLAESKRISPDLIVRLQIEEKKLRLLDFQARVRDEVNQQQQEIMAMPDRPYRKFIRLCERQRTDLARQVQMSQKMKRERQLKSIFQWRKKLLEAHWGIRDARTARNKGVAKYHERMLREFSKRKDDDRDKRMEALKNNDVDRYRQILLEQQTSIRGDAAERYSVLSSFLSQTEEYLHKLGGKITATKNHQEVEEAANAAVAAARSQGLSEEEVKAAATCAGEEVLIRNRFSEMNAPQDSSSVNKYYNLAHAVNEKVFRQPSMLRAGNLRDYQLVGLQWMLSLYNNKLNGILADEMGLGKTVQVMALIAYLMEFKGNYGPHLIIVPNAVLVNWKSELHNWLPSVSCIYYVGGKDQRSKLFSQEVRALKFNVLVTTYEFIMYDRSKLSKVDWKYIIIDEAQRMKDRESVLARDLDKYRCQRRLLLTGTPLQNDLKELWSLLNLLLPEVFDNKRAFNDWFSKPFQKDAPSHNVEDDWLETEKKVIIIHRLHQILEPFMLRRRVEDVEGSLPRKVSIVLRCKMSAIQGAIYDWIKSTNTIRVDPEDELRRVQKNPAYQSKTYKSLNNKCMELRKACNHPLLNYPYFNDLSKDFIVRSCGKLWMLDRILIKLHRTGHRVLLFSTMTKLLDILEEYLQWRRLVFRRIDGTTSLEERESAIVDFNNSESDCFIFLLSIRAAGRGLNLQSADTVVIYDPDSNPKNEEQAVARAHRIGQKREVKVIYMEAVVDKISSHQKEDEMKSGAMVDLEDALAGKDRYMGSIESLIRNNIQQYKIEMADEVINAGRFDQRTTHEERRLTLEALLHDEDRYQETVHDVPSLQEVNRMIARSEEEVELFDQMDEDLDWIDEMTRYDQVPEWLRTGTKEVNTTIAKLSKKPFKKKLAANMGTESSEVVLELSPTKPEQRRARPKGLHVYRELDDDDGEFFETSSEEKTGYPLQEEEREIGEFEDGEVSGAGSVPQANKDQSEEDLVCEVGYEYPQGREGIRSSNISEEAGSSGSSSESRKSAEMMSPSISAQKFGSLSALEARPDSLSKRMSTELAEGEIVVSGDSHMDIQQSGSWIHEHDDGEEEQVLQPKIKRKRSIRNHSRLTMERVNDKSGIERSILQRGSSSQLSVLADHNSAAQLRIDPESETYGEPSFVRDDVSNSIVKNKRNLSSRRSTSASKSNVTPKSGRSNPFVAPAENIIEDTRESRDGKATNTNGLSYAAKMSDVVQRKCKNVISMLHKRIGKDGHQIIPLLMNFWKKTENSSYKSAIGGNNLLDLTNIDQRVDRLEYNGVMDFVADVQSMLRGAAQFFGFSFEVRSEARKVHDLFFEIMKIAFPDTDLTEAKNAVLFSGTGATYAPPPKLGYGSQSKRQKLFNEVGPEPIPPKLFQRVSVSREEDARPGAHMSKFQKESRLSNSSGRDQGPLDEAPMIRHPRDLVTYKRKRNYRDNLIGKPRVDPVSPPSVGRSGRGPSVGPSVAQRDVKSSQQVTNQQSWPQQASQQANGSGGSGGNLSWSGPVVKRTRTDSGKRRPSHV